MRRILLATDGSAGAVAAVGFGAELARATGAWATLACVRRDPPVLGDPGRRERLLRSELRRARGVIDAAARRAAAAGIVVESEILAGDPVTELVGLAEARGVDMIVVGSERGRRAREVGGVAGRLVAQSTCPVLVVKTSPRPSGHRDRACPPAPEPPAGER